jgi:hypothetical protein
MKAFTAPLKEIEDLRNMWEHEIDYLYGRGNAATAGRARSTPR